ncbi:hypothetical protein ACQ9LF_12885 [Anaerohalosphaeraceae bacterium U12dextr]|jgi:hypothetical protein
MRTSKQMIGWDVVVAAIVLVMLMAVWMGGCAGVSVDPVQIQNLAMQTEQLNGKIDQFQEQTKLALQSSKQNGTVDANALAKVEKLQTSIDSVQAKTQAIADAVKNAQYTNPADGVTTALEGARAANAASSPWNPYAPLIDLGLGIAAAAATVIARRNAQAAAEAQAKYDAHKQGVELTMKQVSQSTIPEVKAIETQLYQNIGQARSAVGAS